MNQKYYFIDTRKEKEIIIGILNMNTYLLHNIFDFF